MEALTPPANRHALIVRMPDSEPEFDGSMHRWLDRMEVDEMILREETRRSLNRSTRVITYAATGQEAAIDHGTDIYFVGHGHATSFVGGEDADDLAAWIRQRAVQQPLQNLKIKLVTCNGAGSENSGFSPQDSMVHQLANALKGSATGRVVAFRGYLLSVPEIKMVYEKEPKLEAFKQAVREQKAALREFNVRIAVDLAGIVMPAAVADDDGIRWGAVVLGTPEDQLRAEVQRLCKAPGKALGDLQAALGQWIFKRIAFPSQAKGEVFDHEHLIDRFSGLSHSVNGPSRARDAAAKAFALWREAIKTMTRAEWTRRKKALADAYAKQEVTLKDGNGDQVPAPHEIKQGKGRIGARAEATIP